MVDIANFVAQNFRPQGANMLAQAQQLKGMQQQNELMQQQSNDMESRRNALASGDVNALAAVDPGQAGQLFNLQGGQQRQAAERLSLIAERIATSQNPKAILGVMQGSPELSGLGESLGIDFSQLGDIANADDEVIRQEAASMRDALGNFLGRKSEGPIKLGAGDTLVDPNSFKPIASGAPEETGNISEYQFAVSQGYTGSLQDFIQENKRAGATTIDARNMGNIPPEHRLVEDESGVRLERIPGGPSEAKDEEGDRQRGNRALMTSIQAQTVSEDVSRLNTMIDDLPFGRGAAVQESLHPSLQSDAYRDGTALIESVKGNVGVDSLLRIKASGAGLGQVPQSQLDLLSRLLGELTLTQSKPQFVRTWNRMGDVYEQIWKAADEEMREVDMAPPEIFRGLGEDGWTIKEIPSA